MQLTDMAWPQVKALSADTPVVFPIASLEQHSHHLPLFTDSLLLGEIVKRAAGRLGDRILWAPVMWLGNSDHHIDYPGTLSAQPRTYLDMLSSLLENFLQYGFKRLVLLNGHGGNDVPGKQVVFEVRQRHRSRKDLLLILASYWHIVDLPPASLNLSQKAMGHACECETSMMLHLAPRLVGEYRNLPPVEPGNAFEPASRGWITKDRTTPGHIGHPHLATPEKGAALFELFTEGTVSLLERVLRWDGKSWDG